MALKEITGQRLRLAIIYLADYCIALKKERGFVNVGTEIRYINDNFRLVSPREIEGLVNDVQRFYEAIEAQEVTSINRFNWYEFKSTSVKAALRELIDRLFSLGFTSQPN
ncbi:hypothetical protein [Snodgrassella alvi]|uniref:hypothetical protein n=1 Tax=Snodgrassella alvi TaxID=1196083 RepID=UPI000C1E6D54|nr:hypothetical protein [Snodgrassella alvi]PIT41989.1 hypothetical protein BHC53_03525 [Snodgrassella alvi]